MNLRMLRTLVVGLSLGLGLGGLALAQPPAAGQPASAVDALLQRLEGVRYGLDVSNGNLGGSGAPVLAAAIAQSRYVLIGEDHLTREIPQFTAAICNQTAKQGLAGMALEVSPQAADFMMRTLRAPDRWSQMQALTTAYPFSVAFLNSKQENDMVAACAEASHNPAFQVWGLDQSFEGSAGWLIDQMLAAHPGPIAAAGLRVLKAEEQRDAASARASGDAKALFLIAVSDAELARAAAAIDRDGGDEVKRTFQDLVTSHAIYVKQIATGDANVERARLLKQNFQADVETSARSGTVIVKFGEWHIYKGTNPLHHRDLGDYIAELADVEGHDSLHIAVLGAKGTHRVPGKYGQPGTTEAFTMTDDRFYRWMAPFVAKQIPGQWTLYDLRGLRFQKLGAVDIDLERVVEGYDFLVVIPELTPADLAE